MHTAQDEVLHAVVTATTEEILGISQNESLVRSAKQRSYLIRSEKYELAAPAWWKGQLVASAKKIHRQLLV